MIVYADFKRTYLLGGAASQLALLTRDGQPHVFEGHAWQVTAMGRLTHLNVASLHFRTDGEQNCSDLRLLCSEASGQVGMPMHVTFEDMSAMIQRQCAQDSMAAFYGGNRVGPYVRVDLVQDVRALRVVGRAEEAFAPADMSVVPVKEHFDELMPKVVYRGLKHGSSLLACVFDFESLSEDCATHGGRLRELLRKWLARDDERFGFRGETEWVAPCSLALFASSPFRQDLIADCTRLEAELQEFCRDVLLGRPLAFSYRMVWPDKKAGSDKSVAAALLADVMAIKQ